MAESFSSAPAISVEQEPIQYENEQQFVIKTEVNTDDTEHQNLVQHQMPALVSDFEGTVLPIVNQSPRIDASSNFDLNFGQRAGSSGANDFVRHGSHLKAYPQLSQGFTKDRPYCSFAKSSPSYQANRERQQKILAEQKERLLFNEQVITNEVKRDLFCVLIPDIDACLESSNHDPSYSALGRPHIARALTAPDVQGNFTVRYYEGRMHGQWWTTLNRGSSEVINTKTVLFCFNWVRMCRKGKHLKQLPATVKKRITNAYQPIMKALAKKKREMKKRVSE